MALAREGLGANGAGEGFDTAVEFQVGFAVLLASEAFVADGALVRLLARVRAHVDVEVAAEGELFAAGRAREPGPLRVDADVTLQVGQAREALVALLAAVLAP